VNNMFYGGTSPRVMELKDAMSDEQYDAMIKEIAAEVFAYQELEELDRKSELFKRWLIK